MDGWMDKQHVRTEEGDKRPRTEGATALRSEQQQFTTPLRSGHNNNNRDSDT